MRRIHWIILKVLASLMIIAALFKYSAAEFEWRIVAESNYWLLALAGVLILSINIISGMRWWVVIDGIREKFGLASAIRITLVSQVFNILLPSAIGGDGIRIWFATLRGLKLSGGARSVLIDRVTGLVTMLLFILFGLPFYMIDDSRVLGSVAVAAVSCILSLALLFGFDHLPKVRDLAKHDPHLSRPRRLLGRLLRLACEVSANARGLVQRKKHIAAIVALCIIIQIGLAASLTFIAEAVNISVPLSHALLFVPTAMLFSALPIAIGGWGVREGALMFLLQHDGVLAGSAFAISILFGLVLAGSSIIGSAAFLFDDNRGAPQTKLAPVA